MIQMLLNSWDRQCACINNLLTLMNPELLEVKPSEDGWNLAIQFAHIVEVRTFWFSNAAETENLGLPSLFTLDGEIYRASRDIDAIRTALLASEQAIRNFLAAKLKTPESPCGGYETPINFLQHMIWHEGWHAGLIMLGLRLAGHEPTDVWEETNLWSMWRTE